MQPLPCPVIVWNFEKPTLGGGTVPQIPRGHVTQLVHKPVTQLVDELVFRLGPSAKASVYLANRV